MSIWGKIAARLKVKHNSSYSDNTEVGGEWLENPDIYIKYTEQDGKSAVRLLFTNKDNEWSEFEALFPEERAKYVQDVAQISLYLASLHNKLTEYESKKKIVCS